MDNYYRISNCDVTSAPRTRTPLSRSFFNISDCIYKPDRMPPQGWPSSDWHNTCSSITLNAMGMHYFGHRALSFVFIGLTMGTSLEVLKT